MRDVVRSIQVRELKISEIKEATLISLHVEYWAPSNSPVESCIREDIFGVSLPANISRSILGVFSRA